MLKIKVLFLFLAAQLGGECLYAQNFGIAGGINYGNYNMRDIRDFENEMIKTFPVKVMSMSSFPSYIGYEGNFFVALNRLRVGLSGSFNSTGSRISYNDYSGKIEIDQLAMLKALGLFCDYILVAKSDVWEPFLSLKASMGKTNYKLETNIALGDDPVSEEKLVFESKHVLLAPSIGIRRYLLKRFFAAITAGLVLDAADALRYKENHDLHLLNGKHGAVRLDWSGLRLGLSAGVKL